MTYTHPVPVDVATVPCRRDPEKQFPTSHGDKRTRDDAAAKTVCTRGNNGRPCHLLAPCLRYALRHTVEGVWGATTEEERKKMQEANGIVPLPLVSPVPPRRDVYGRVL